MSGALLEVAGRQPLPAAMDRPAPKRSPPLAPTVTAWKVAPYQGNCQGSATSASPSSDSPRSVPTPVRGTKS